MTSAQQLADALKDAGIAAPEITRQANVSLRIAANAICGRPVATISYLRICRAINFDPEPMLKTESARGPDFDFAFFAMGLYVRRRLNNHTERQAAKAIGVSPSTVCRAERREPMQIKVVLEICRYIGVHPFGYMRECST
jgi:DNA-binding XRE family transcriptional regulator